MRSRPWLVLLAGGGALLLGVVLLGRSPKQPAAAPPAAVEQPQLAQPSAVSALGTLEPAGGIRHLSAPIAGMGGSPRISALLVETGDSVRKGQVLAVFDNRPRLEADLAALQARLQRLDAQIRLQQREIQRYQQAASSGAASQVLLEEKRDELVKLQGERREAQAQIAGLRVDLAQSELRSPIDGTVLRVISRAGERPGSDGVLEVGASDQMEAVAEVYETDIDRVRLGQSVRLTSENGGFSGSLSAKVLRIEPQVRQRTVLSTDPTGDADARIVEVRLALDPADAAKVRSLAGLKVIARFNP